MGDNDALPLAGKATSGNAKKGKAGAGGAGDSPAPAANKRLSVERIYQKKSQLEHILLRPDTYVGSIEHQTTSMWVMDQEAGVMVQRDISFVPGLYKIFDEILVNASDNKQRDNKMDTIKIDIDVENNKISVWNNGLGIPVVMHKEEKMYVPTLIFGHLLTSSNYNDFDKKVTGGRNGYGAKLCNIFSNKFTVETSSKSSKKSFRQSWTNNMGKTKEPKIADAKTSDYTCITFEPDLSKFKMEKLDKDIVDLFTRRAYDIAASTKGIKVILNGTRVAVKNFKDYIDLYTKDKVDENGVPLKIVYEQVSPRWEVACCLSSEKGFQQVSFVNSIATTKGGRHVDYVVDQVTKKLAAAVTKKSGKNTSGPVKPFTVKNSIWVFVNCLIENPSFDSQTKENMTLQAKQFGSTCELDDAYINKVTKCGILEHILNWVKFKAQAQLNRKGGAKTSKLKGIPKLDDANEAGTKSSEKCTLILTEGDSAKTLAVAGLSVIGRDHFGVFPLKGKMLNVREATHKQIMENAEINNIIKILGLQYKLKYAEYDEVKKLRYGKVMIMTDQDQDGSHIKGLLINFIHTNWPNLLKHNFLVEFITPIVKVTKNKKEQSFYSLPEFEEWKAATDNWHTYKIKYYKGLGTSTSKEAKEYFSDMARHRIPFRYSGAEDDTHITLAFSKQCITERKNWLTNWMQARKTRQELGLAQDFLYTKDTKKISFSEFVNKELVLFSNLDNERSIPCLIDGMKPGQRKVLFTCLKRNLTKELKVAQLAGSVAEISAYHHGEASLMGTIVGLAQSYVGSNNLNLLEPIGQFGTRLHGGKDSASPRYIFTCLSELTRLVFHPHDDCVLNNLNDDGLKIEPEWYCPIIPMVLINGASGIGTGWSTTIPNFDVRDVLENIRRLIKNETSSDMKPSYRGFNGQINRLEDMRFTVSGEIGLLGEDTIEIIELPVGTWTQDYKEKILEPMVCGTEKIPVSISEYKEYHTDTTVRFVVKMTREQFLKAESAGLYNFFKIQNVLTTTNMVLFDEAGVLKQYKTPDEILKVFYKTRLAMYDKRKQYLDGMLDAEARKLSNQARFILEKIEGKIVIENKKKKDLIQTLTEKGFESDPIKSWKESQSNDNDESADDEETAGTGPDFNYLLNMSLLSLSKEKKDELLKQRDDKKAELMRLRNKSSKDLWNEDLDAFEAGLQKYEADQAKAEKAAAESASKQSSRGGKFKAAKSDTMPSKYAERVEPTIPTHKITKTKSVTKKEKEDPKQNKLDTFGFGGAENGDDDIQEIKTPGTAAKPKAKAKPKTKSTASSGDAKSASPAKRSNVGGGTKASSGSPARKKKAGDKKPWEFDDNDSDSLGLSDSDDDIKPKSAPTREKAAGSRASAGKAKYKFDESESGLSSRDSSPEPVATEARSKSPPPNLDLSSSLGLTPSPEPTKKAASPKKTTTAKKAAVGSSADDAISLSGEDSDVPASKPKAAAKQPAAKKPAAKKPAAKSAPATKKPAAAKKAAEPKKRKLLGKTESDDKQTKLNFGAVTTKKTVPVDSFTITDSEDEGKVKSPPKKRSPAKKPSTAANKRKKKVDSDSEDFEPSKKRTTSTAVKRGTKKSADKSAEDSESDSNIDDSLPAAPRAAAARGKKAVKYFSDSESD